MHRLVLLLLLLLPACGDASSDAGSLDDLALVLVPAADGGEPRGDLDRRLVSAQEEVRRGGDVVAALEGLGRLYVAKARLAQDPGFYKLAEACADGIARRSPEHCGGRLLRGHVLHSLHRFAEAEAVARRLVADRGAFADHGLLGDVLYDRGRVEEALASYQRMLDLKPCLQSYARAAQVRWLCGDLDGARQLLQLAIGAGSHRDPEALCWAYARLALVELQAGQLAAAAEQCARAQAIDADAVSVLLARARVLAADDQWDAACSVALRAAELCPLPEHRWLAIDLLERNGDPAGAAALAADLRRSGARDDARHFALFLLSRGEDRPRALALATQELAARQDVFTHDLHAWALLANDRVEAAQTAMDAALALGTGDARIEYHAGAIAAARGDAAAARTHFAVAQRRAGTLWPSERADLARRMAAL